MGHSVAGIALQSWFQRHPSAPGMSASHGQPPIGGDIGAQVSIRCFPTYYDTFSRRLGLPAAEHTVVCRLAHNGVRTLGDTKKNSACESRSVAAGDLHVAAVPRKCLPSHLLPPKGVVPVAMRPGLSSDPREVRGREGILCKASRSSKSPARSQRSARRPHRKSLRRKFAPLRSGV